jgi:restriction system protein
MKQYKRIMLGAKSKYADECYEGKFIGIDYGIPQDLTHHLPEFWRDFNKEFIPVYLKNHPDKTKVAAGLACGMLWTVAKGLNKGDIVLCPDGKGNYYVGEIDSLYYYKSGEILPHRRNVKWYPVIIERSAMSENLQRSTGSIGTVSDITGYAEEIEELIGGNKPPKIISEDKTIEDPSVFALEKHLEAFLVENWRHTELGKKYNIYEDEGEQVGQQFPSDTGPIDILAISKDKKTLLVVELKKGRVSDNVVGQIQRYMGYVKEELAENDQEVKGVIIALEDDVRIKRALSVTNNIEFYRYKVNFKLFKA